jgi:ubiquinone/menaquinone biosynthesis C-methylase UbiE
MNNRYNRQLYRLYYPLYDRLMSFWTKSARHNAVTMLDLKAGEQLLIPGVGTGLDLPHIPAEVCTVAVDLSPAMLQQAQGKRQELVGFGVMDGQYLAFPSHCFDAVLLNLILSVVPDGKQALEESWRVLRPGGRMVVFDKFLPDPARSTVFRRLLGSLIRRLGTDPNRRFSEMVKNLPAGVITEDEPVLLRGQYRIILLKKPLQA